MILVPTPIVLEDDPEVTVARVVLGLTIYVDDGRAWARKHAAALLRTFLERIDREDVAFVRTSRSLKASIVSLAEHETILTSLSVPEVPSKPRHGFFVELGDDPGAPSLGFFYRESDERREGASSFVQIFMPVTTDPNELLALAIEIGQRFPFLSFTGGYQASINRRYAGAAYERLFGLCVRYLGLHVDHPEHASRVAREGLTGLSWLTGVGTPLGFDVEGLRLAHGVLVRAGERPELGDRHMLAAPLELAALHAQLEPLLVKNLPELPGPFDGRTEDYRHRLLHPSRFE